MEEINCNECGEPIGLSLEYCFSCGHSFHGKCIQFATKCPYHKERVQYPNLKSEGDESITHYHCITPPPAGSPLQIRMYMGMTSEISAKKLRELGLSPDVAEQLGLNCATLASHRLTLKDFACTLGYNYKQILKLKPKPQQFKRASGWFDISTWVDVLGVQYSQLHADVGLHLIHLIDEQVTVDELEKLGITAELLGDELDRSAFMQLSHFSLADWVERLHLTWPVLKKLELGRDDWKYLFGERKGDWEINSLEKRFLITPRERRAMLGQNDVQTFALPDARKFVRRK